MPVAMKALPFLRATLAPLPRRFFPTWPAPALHPPPWHSSEPTIRPAGTRFCEPGTWLVIHMHFSEVPCKAR